MHAPLVVIASATGGGSFSAGPDSYRITCTHTAAANMPKYAPERLPAPVRV